MKVLDILKKTEVYFISALFALNVYCAIALRGDSYVDPTHLTLSVVLLVMLNERLIEKIEKK